MFCLNQPDSKKNQDIEPQPHTKYLTADNPRLTCFTHKPVRFQRFRFWDLVIVVDLFLFLFIFLIFLHGFVMFLTLLQKKKNHLIDILLNYPPPTPEMNLSSKEPFHRILNQIAGNGGVL